MLFEVLITRVLSVTLAYHFAFLSVSLAMLGLGAPGVWFSLSPPGPRAMSRALVASGLALPLSILAIVHVGASFRGVTTFWVVCLLAPLIALGSAVCLLLLRAKGDQIGRMYGADLVGAALGAVLVVPLLHGLPTPSVLAALGLLPLVAAMLLEPRTRLIAVPASVLLVASVWHGGLYRLHYTKFDDEGPLLYERWSPTARVTVGEDPAGNFFGWGMGARWNRPPPDHLWINQDGSAGTEILRFHPTDPFPEHLLFDVTAAAYELAPVRRTCIIGGGGGRDILTALAGGAREVEVVELNPYIVDAVSQVFGSYSGDPYHLPGVYAFVGEGRDHFSRSGSSCDVLQISLIDTFAATAAGAYALTENSLYTVEALRAFLSRLSPDGVLSISRWAKGPGRSEALRLVVLAQEALRQEGVADVKGHLIVLGAGASANTMLFRRAVDRTMVARVTEVASRRGFEVLWPVAPDIPATAGVTDVLRNGPAALMRLGLDLSPTTDDRPFFFQTLDLLAGSEELAQLGSGEREQSVWLLRKLLLGLTVLTLGLFFLPVVVRGRLPHGSGAPAATAYFAALGLGFMFVEIPVLHRLALYLGHPSYATTVVLAAMLLGAGMGAAIAVRIPRARARLAAFGVPVVLGAAILPLIGPLAAATAGWGFAGRAAIAAGSVFVAGVAMGLPFPLGMARFDDRDRSWFWAVNGAAGVLSSVLALVLSLLTGFFHVILVALACYSIAALLLPREQGDRADG